MSKYIVEPDEDAKAIQSINITSLGNVYTESWYVENLEELNSDYINEHFSDLQDTAYQRGLDDAWEAAKKIFGYEKDGGIPIDEIGKVFGYAEDATFCTADIIRHNTASEAIAKLKAYEEQKADELKVGDEVDWSGDRFIVTRIYQPLVDKRCNGIAKDGSVYMDVVCDRLTKTGRHFDIDKILEEMRS